MEQIDSFFQMGGYAAFVWPSLGLTAIILIVMAATSFGRMRGAERTLEDAEIRFGRRRPNADRN